MHSTSIFLLLGAAAVVAILHSILPDHWVPLAVVARTQRWSIPRVVRVTFFASIGHVITSLILGGILALIGLQFQKEIDTQQGHIVGAVLILTGIIFLIWGWIGSGPHQHNHSEGHTHDHDVGHRHNHDHTHEYQHNDTKEQSVVKRLAAIAVPFGVAASPDLTILPVALAASAVGTVAVLGVLSVFALFTIATFISFTVLATLAGYQMKGDWLEKNANTVTCLVLITIGIVAYLGFECNKGCLLRSSSIHLQRLQADCTLLSYTGALQVPFPCFKQIQFDRREDERERKGQQSAICFIAAQRQQGNSRC